MCRVIKGALPLRVDRFGNSPMARCGKIACANLRPRRFWEELDDLFVVCVGCQDPWNRDNDWIEFWDWLCVWIFESKSFFYINLRIIRVFGSGLCTFPIQYINQQLTMILIIHEFNLDIFDIKNICIVQKHLNIHLCRNNILTNETNTVSPQRRNIRILRFTIYSHVAHELFVRILWVFSIFFFCHIDRTETGQKGGFFTRFSHIRMPLRDVAKIVRGSDRKFMQRPSKRSM